MGTKEGMKEGRHQVQHKRMPTLTLKLLLPYRYTDESNRFQRAWLWTHVSMGSPLSSTSSSEAIVEEGGSSGSSINKRKWRRKLPLTCSSNLYQ